jgi:NAD+-processing family protein with receiver domain
MDELMIDLWLDDMRPAPDGWVHVKTVEEAQEYLRGGIVRRASLDHDLGACARCYDGTLERWLEEHAHQSMPHCEHFGTGYTLVRWMEENDCWPLEKPTVHSANPIGQAKMKAVIERKFGAIREPEATLRITCPAY